MESLRQLRLCVEKVAPHEIKILQNIYSGPNASKLSAAFWKEKRWEDNTELTIGFLDEGNDIPKISAKDMEKASKNSKYTKLDPLFYELEGLSPKEIVKKVILERYQKITNLKFKFVEDNPHLAMVRISFDKDGGSWSLVGKDILTEKEKATMNFGWLDPSVILHEWGHLCGLIHEHSSSLNGNIEWDEDAVYKWAEQTQGWTKDITKTNIIDKYSYDQLNGSDFDPLSVMLYFFPPELTKNHKGTQINPRLSGVDVQWLFKEYPLDDQSIPATFYQNVYGQSLQSAIEQSQLLSKEFASNASKWANFGKYMLYLVCVSLLIINIWLVYKYVIKPRRIKKR